MKHLVVAILFIVSLCRADNFWCQIFNEETKSLDLYCANFQKLAPKTCSNAKTCTDSCKVVELKVGGCDNNTASYAIRRYKDIRVLDVTYSGYQTLEWLDYKLEHLQLFNVTKNKITDFPWTLLKHIPEIIEMDLSYNSLRNIYRDGSVTAHKLVKIHLSHNYLRYIEYEAFKHFIRLEYIDLSGNFLRTIPSFGYNKMLKVLHLMNNNIQTFDFCFSAKMYNVTIHFSWMTVKTLVQGNSCRGMVQIKPFDVVYDSRDEGVFVTSNGKREIHCNEFSFHSLFNFTGGHSSLNNVSDLLHYFGSSLQIIDLSANAIQSLNDSIFDRFIYMTELSLSNNQLMAFDFSILKTRRLNKIDISSNVLRYLKHMPSLQMQPLIKFDVTDNQLKNTPELIQFLRTTIQELALSGNWIGKLNATTFQRFIKLKTLKISNTSLFIDDFNPFDTLKGLRALDISHNNLTNVDFATLSMTLIRLNEFNASYCHITNASELIQFFGPILTNLDLSGNFFGTVNIRTFETLKSLEYLYLSNVNIIHFDVAAIQYQMCLQILDISYNRLHKVDLDLLPNNLKALYLQGNELSKVDNLRPSSMSLDIAKNQISCMFLRQFISNHKNIKFIGNPLDQKHSKNCRSSTQGITDFLDSLIQQIKFW